ncbi:alkene reductase [Noviherbaspirillum sp. Root189]|uniref:alkene reductase n=1 Tax=Noviherbaspirillum sp. Root189 TaxID=1736487 RepID=UPI000709178E|nr:alkene reductase [Noviherbaspirillum sp. Root189]KRB93801.1 alkene reductase [Noviherbaspirillum sp. Root189]
MVKHLLSPVKAGSIILNNRAIMAPLTRSRAGQPGDVPTDLNVEYYAQRAGAGLIVSEGTQVSPQGQGYAWTPGIYSDAQEASWKKVTAAVHAKGGRIAAQLWHVGRISHTLLQPGGAAPVAPSAIIAANSKCFVVQPDGTPANVPTSQPRALATSEIPGIVDQYRQAAARAGRAGFDFVEIHGANGYLPHQFLSTNTNHRTDQYGGPVENRARFLLEVVDAAVAELGADRVGVRLSPHFIGHDIADEQADESTLYLAKEFSRRGIAYLHIAEPDWVGGPELSDEFRRQIRSGFTGLLIFCGGYTADEAEALIANGIGDAVGFGRPFLANPDLVERFRRGAELNAPDKSTFYGGGARGYTDYPTLKQAA